MTLHSPKLSFLEYFHLGLFFLSFKTNNLKLKHKFSEYNFIICGALAQLNIFNLEYRIKIQKNILIRTNFPN